MENGLTEKQQHKLDEIMDQFEFYKVQRVMESLDWRWAGVGGVPTTADLRQHVRERLTEMAVRRNARASNPDAWEDAFISGGLWLEHFGGRDENGPWENFRCMFVLEEWTTEEAL